jgi:molybdate transport system substrate-binding protein
MKKLLFILAFASFTFASEIRIAIASNVSYVIKPLITEFNKNNKTKVKFVIGSSGKLTAQIRNKAPYDIFLSANMKYPNALYKDKVTVIKPKIYAKGSLVLFSYKNRVLKDLNIINTVKNITIANPKTAPYGKAAYEVLLTKKLFEKNKKKFVYAENIAQTLQYIYTAVDIGFIAKASLYAEKMRKFKKNINYLEIEDSLHKPINQGVALLNNKEETLKFYDFLFSKEAKKIFKNYGYEVE